MDLLWQAFSFYLLAAVSIHHVIAVYDPSNPSYHEIFDPEEADPRGAIVCDGAPPPFPIDPITVPNEQQPVDVSSWTLQELCTKPQYGGKGPYMHAGGFCLRYLYWQYNPRIAFDTLPGAMAAEGLQYARIKSYCQLRCFCTGVESPIDRRLQIDAKDGPGPGSIIIDPQQQTMEPVYVTSEYLKFYEFLDANQLSWQIGHSSGIAVRHGVTRPLENQIQCEGSIPAYLYNSNDPFIHSYGRHIAGSAQLFCANALEGGDV